MTRHRRCTCPECRTRFTAKDLPQIYCDVRDKRTRQLLAAARPEEAPTIDLTDPPSSSRAGTPTQDVDEDDEESGSSGGYPPYVQNHAARCVDLVAELDKKATDAQVKKAGVEVKAVVDGIDARPGDHIWVRACTNDIHTTRRLLILRCYSKSLRRF